MQVKNLFFLIFLELYPVRAEVVKPDDLNIYAYRRLLRPISLNYYLWKSIDLVDEKKR